MKPVLERVTSCHRTCNIVISFQFLEAFFSGIPRRYLSESRSATHEIFFAINEIFQKGARN